MGSPATSPCPPPGCLEGCRQESRSRLALGIVPGPCREGRSGARSQSCPSARREAPLQSLRGGDLQPPGAGSLQRKSLVLHFQRMLPAAPEVGRLQAPPGSKHPSKGQLWGRVRGRGQRVLSRSETPRLPATHTQSWCWAPGPEEGSYYSTALPMSLGCSGLF